jgi:hypothetical protein
VGSVVGNDPKVRKLVEGFVSLLCGALRSGGADDLAREYAALMVALQSCIDEQ